MKDKDIIEYVKGLQKSGIQISVTNNDLDVRAPKGTMTREIMEELKQKKTEIINYLAGVYAEKSNIKPILNLTGNYPMSNAQRRLWVLSQMEEGGSVAYNTPSSMHLPGTYDIECFKKAIDSTIERHEILRTVFKENKTGEVRQWVLSREDLGFRIDYKDFRKEENKEQKAKEYIAEDAYKPFDLEKGPLLRASLLQLEDDAYVFYYNMHHIISDGWSMGVLSRDMLAYYEAFKANEEPELNELRIQYKDYSVWQLDQLEEESFKAHRAYWLESLSGELPLLDLPGTKRRPRLKTYNGQGLSTYINRDTTGKLKKYSEQNGGSLFMGLLAAWNVLVYRYTSQTDVITGTPIAGREHADLEDQIGFYISTLALRNEIKPDESFNELFSRVKQNSLLAYAHQMYPFDRLVEELNLQKDTSRSAVFDVLLALQNNGEKVEGLELSKEELNEITDLGYDTSTFDMRIDVQEVGDYLSLRVVYNYDVYDREMVEGLITHYKQLLDALLESPEQTISQTDYLLKEEKHELLVTFNDTQVLYPEDKTVVALFEEQVKKTPNAIAVIFEEKELTYRELNEKSDQLAHYLRESCDIATEDFVGIQLHRSEWLIIAILGILKAGGTYVPIDPGYPSSRKEHIIKDTALKLLITEANFIHDIDYYEGSVFAIDVEFDTLDCNTDSLLLATTSTNLAYVIYTSGSTGKPKGVMVEHRSLSNYLTWALSKYSNGSGNLDFGLFTSLSFDLTVTSIYLPLISGGTLTIFNSTSDTPQLVKAYFQSGIGCVKLTPAHVSLLKVLDIVDTVIRVVIVGGEALGNMHVETLKKLNPHIQIYNEYGPTESTVGCIAAEISSIEEDITIGKPISNTQIYLLSEEQELQPKGTIGEICIGGTGLARGYLNQENLTKEKFIANPFKAGERLYKTGDLGRWLTCGNIEFIGRKDDQVKVRGYRIELGEIEQVLKSYRSIEEAIVLAKENQNNEKELVAYITSKAEQNTNELRSYLKETLPEYMLPAYYIQLAELPLTSNGKIDKKSLPDPKGLMLANGIEYVAPRNETEERLVKIWEDILKRENVGVKDNFFTLGGHSLKLIKVINQINKQFGLKYDLKGVYSEPTIESMSQRIQDSKRSEFMQIEKAAQQAGYPISDAQRRLWVLSQFEDGSVAYNMPGNVYLEQNINIDYFKKAIESTIERHEMLRTVFKEDETGEIKQWVLKSEDLGFEIACRDFSKDVNKEEKVKEYIAEDSYKPFDLENGPLLRASLIKVEEEAYAFYYNMHHIISDGWSMDILTRDVLSYYEAYKNDKEPALKELRIQYKDYSTWQLLQLEEESFKAHRSYWLNNLSGELPVLDLPGTKQRPKVKTNNGYELYTCFDQAISGKLKEYSHRNGGSLFMTLLAVWNVLIYRYTSQTNIIIGTPMAGREHADLEDQIGFYINTLALKNEIKPGENFDELFSRIKQNSLNAYAHQMYPFDRLVEELNPQRDTSRSAVFDILLTFQNDNENNDRLDTVAIGSKEEEENVIKDLGYSASKFDIDITFQEANDSLSLHLVYNSDIYEREMIEGLINHYRQLLNALLENPEEKISQIDYLSDEEKHTLLVTFNDTKAEYPKETFVELFESQVKKTPNNRAVIFEEKNLSYLELDVLSNQLAYYLQKNYEIKPDDLVGIRQQRSEWALISILAVLKSGGAYVPIDPQYPLERIEYLEKDAGLKVCIDENELLKFKQAQETYPKNKPASFVKANNLAYVIYTSGTTGRPKGVMIEHAGMLNHLYVMAEELNLNQESVVVQNAAYTFDISVWQLLNALIVGGTTAIYSSETILNPERFIESLRKNKATILQVVPSYLKSILDIELDGKRKCFENIKYLSVTGEAVNKELLQEWFNFIPDIKVINAYGPAEASDDVTLYVMDKAPEVTNIPVGKPIKNIRICLLDETNKLCPVGIPGEICVSGIGLARGYLNNEPLTLEKFVENPYCKGERMYKTGDIGRWLPDGNIEYIERRDHQVKIRGYRIELGEIESALRGYDKIEEAVVIARPVNGSAKELIAYIVSGEELSSSGLRSYLSGSLPLYMIPGHFIQIEKIPLSPNGKVDRKKLPDPLGLGMSTGVEYMAPRNEVEKKLVEIWSDVLRIDKDKIGVQDDFFALGGHSLKAVIVKSKIHQHFNIKLSLELIFNDPNIEVLSRYIEAYSFTENRVETNEELII